jgi:hypothetical protein
MPTGQNAAQKCKCAKILLVGIGNGVSSRERRKRNPVLKLKDFSAIGFRAPNWMPNSKVYGLDGIWGYFAR